MQLSILSALGLSGLAFQAYATQPSAGEVKEAQQQDPEPPTGVMPCEDPQEIPGNVFTVSGYVRCADGRIMRDRAWFTLPAMGPGCPFEETDEWEFECTQDSDCTERPFGSCIADRFGQIPACGCEYSCMSDLDCGAGEICAVEGVTGRDMPVCVKSLCRANWECPSGQCEGSPNRQILGGPQDYRFGCRSERDTCRTDADCTATDGLCDYCDLNIRSGRWECAEACIAIGRPFLIEGEHTLADLIPGHDWIAKKDLHCSELTASQKASAAKHWLLCARMEHASVAAFARFALQLMHLGAPPELLESTASAMQDEIAHAKACFALAKRYSQEALTPGPLEVSQALCDELDPAQIAIDVFLEGCVGETVAALEATEMGQLAQDEEVRSTLLRISQDEHQHALLAWRSLNWMIKTLPESSVQDVLSALTQEVAKLHKELLEAPTMTLAQVSDLEAHGVPGEQRRASLRRQAIAQVVLPCAHALLRGQPQGVDVQQPEHRAV